MILDEAHERKLEADKLLVHLAAACKARPQFKVVIMSATIDVAEYADMIKGNGVPGPCPTLDVKGVTFPVNTIWWEGQPWDPQGNTAMTDLALESVRVYLHSKAGHLLVFVSTVHAVRQLVHDLTGMMKHDKACAVMGLYGAMNNTEREQVADFSKFPKNQGKRLLCVATNVAEAGITIAGRSLQFPSSDSCCVTESVVRSSGNKNGVLMCFFFAFPLPFASLVMPRYGCP